MVQGGDIESGDGSGTLNVYGEDEFEDENLGWRNMDVKGLVCSANRGKNTNGCQYAQSHPYLASGERSLFRVNRFFITLAPCPHLNRRNTIFGHLVKGEETLDRIASVAADEDGVPEIPVLVSRCGELEKRKKDHGRVHQSDPISQESRDRGRRRHSTDRDVEMEDSPEPRTMNKYRRQSDNIVDEGLRGRPRQRSGSRSPSKPLSIHSEDDETGDSADRGSPTKVHKRKRSASPSRHGDGERRRRSLPNQYRDDRFNRHREDDDRYRPSPRRDDYRHPGRRQNDAWHSDGRQDDRYRPSRERNPHDDHGRLGGGSYDDYEPPVKFKGRGIMKY